MLLYLVRHAPAAVRDRQSWPDDRDRPLTRKGRRRFRKAAAGLRALAPRPDVVLSSPYRRTWQTAAVLRRVAGWPAPAACPALGAERGTRDALAEIEEQRGRDCVALVGHNPYLGELMSLLLTGSESGFTTRFKKGAVACLELDDAGSDATTLLWLLPPKALRRMRPKA